MAGGTPAGDAIASEPRAAPFSNSDPGPDPLDACPSQPWPACSAPVAADISRDSLTVLSTIAVSRYGFVRHPPMRFR